MDVFRLTHEERVALTFIAHNDPRDGFVRRTWLEFKTAICGLLQRTRGNGWISVNERLPEDGEPTLVSFRLSHWTDEMPSIVDVMWYESGCFVEHAEKRKSIVTHWMPLPEPPRPAQAAGGG